MAWCFVCLIEAVWIAVTAKKKMSTLSYVGEVPVALHILTIAVLFAVLYILFEKIKNIRTEKMLLVLVTVLYAFTAVIQTPDVWFCTGMVLLLTFTFSYAFEPEACIDTDTDNTAGTATQAGTSQVNTQKTGKLSGRRGLHIICIVSGVLFVLFTGGCTALRVLAYEAPNFDCGLFSQMFHYMKTTFTMNTTSERDHLLSHLCVHISPDFYLLLPFYALYSKAVTLQVMQAVVIALGIVPLLGICKNHGLTRMESALTVIAYCLYPVMSGGCFYDIHENLFLPLFILSFLYFLEKENLKGSIISLILLLGVKEDAAVYAVCILVYMLVVKKKTGWKRHSIMLAASLLYFIFTTVLLSVIGDGVMTYRFNNMVYGDSGSMSGMIRTVLADPAYLVTQVLTQEKLEFIMQTMGALLFLPLVSKKWSRYILTVPYILFNLMSDYTYFHSIYFQYAFGSGTLLFYLAVVNLSELRRELRVRAVPMLAAACLLFFGATVYQRSSVIERYNSAYNQEVYANFNEALSLIPKDAGVTATTFLCPALSARDILYELYYTDKTTEYIALDLRTGSTDFNVDDYLNNGRYETIYYKAFQIAVFRDLQYNDEK